MRSSRRRVLLAATAASLAVHGFVYVMLTPSPGTRRSYPEQRSVQIELLPPSPVSRRIVLSEKSKRGTRYSSPITSSLPGAVPTKVEVPRSAESVSGDELVSSPAGTAVAPAPNLRLSDGCDLQRLTAAERRACERQQLAEASRKARPLQVTEDLSQGGRFAPRETLPYLARDPKNGCKVKTGGGSGVGMKDPMAAGVACKFSF